MITSIQTIFFFRTAYDYENGKKEQGILLNEGEFRLIDGYGNVLDDVYSYTPTSDISLFNLKIGEPHKSYSIEFGKIGDRFRKDLKSESMWMIIKTDIEGRKGDKLVRCVRIDDGSYVEADFLLNVNVYFY